VITRRGWATIVATVAAYGGAVLLHYPELGILAAGGLSALVLGLGWVLRRPNMAVERTIEPVRVTRGKVAVGMLRIANPGRLSISSTVAEERFGDRTITVPLPRLAPGASRQTTYRLPTERRAVVEVGPLTITRSDPFGCWKTSLRLGSVATLWVHPVVHPLPSVPAGQTRSLDGADANELRQGSITFHSLHEYVPGDDQRRIHWRTSARMGKLMIRELVDTTVPRSTLILDTAGASYGSEKFEEAVEVAASLVVTVTGAGLPLRLLTTGGSVVVGSGSGADGQHMLDMLAGVSCAGTGSLGPVTTGLSAERRGDVLLVVSSRPSEADMVGVGSLAERFSRGVVVLVGGGAPVPVALPSHMRLIRVDTASQIAASWGRVGAR
jgi:uncharacterized protein (DUF58 family)